MSNESMQPMAYQDKVTVVAIKTILKEALAECQTWTYETEKCGEATKTLSDKIRDGLKALGKDRYKYMVQVVIGESREQGIRSGTRCFWDTNTDQHASETVINDNIFVCATAWALYYP